MPDGSPDISEILDELYRATEAVKEAAKLEDEARRVHINVRNRLSNAQKAVDDMIGKLKVAAPPESPWAEQMNKDRRNAEEGL